MNTPLRKVAVACLVLFGLLLGSVNYLQVVAADRLRDNPGNSRVLLRTYERERGAIVVGGQAVAESIATDDALEYLRRYPGGATYAPVTGFYSLVYGAREIERTEDGILSGEDDRLFARRLSDLVTGREPQGGTVTLTLNRAAQDAAARGLDGKRGAVVALNPATGAILAMASGPSYDPSLISTHEPAQIRADYNRLADDPARPLLNRAIAETYPPGSTFKVVTAAAALEAGRTPETVVPAPDALDLPQSSRELRNFGGERCSPTGSQTIADALRISCNTAFGQLGLDLGADALRAQAQRFGVGRELEVPLRVAPSVFPEEADAPQTALSAIGQYDVRLTPVQAAMIAAGVANRGTVMAPYLVETVQAPDLAVLDSARPEELSRAVSPEVAAQLTTMMTGVVRGGTGTAAAIPGVQVAGKTGTAQHAEGAAPHAWFIGFAPAQDPQVAVAVVVEDGGSAGSEATGGRVAAPIARSVMSAVLSSAR